MLAVSQSKLTEVFNRLYAWIGTFWSRIYADPDFIKHIQAGRSLRVAQLYLDFLENLHLVDRRNAPVFHRERWYPVIIRKSEKNTGSLSILKLGDNHAVIGDSDTPQDPVYPDGIEFKLGVNTEFSLMETYPIHGHLDDIHSCIVDNIISPKVILRKGVDFIMDDDSIAIATKFSPFGGDSPFPKFEIIDNGDLETVLWACDTLVDENYVNNYLGYVTRVDVDSSELGKNIVNAYWDMLNYASPECLSVLVATLCKVPYAKEDGEVVEQILENAVITDKNVYRFDCTPEYRAKTVVGAKFRRGEYFDTAIRILPFVTSVDQVNAFLAQTENYTLEDALDEVAISSDITNSGKSYVARWTAMGREDFQTQYDIPNACMPEGDGDIIPAKYFLENVIGANTLFIVLDTAKLASVPVYQSKYFRLIRESIPAYIRLVVTGKDKVDETVDLSSTTDSAYFGAGVAGTEEYNVGSMMSEKVYIRVVSPCCRL